MLLCIYSCKEVYEPDVENKYQGIVVEGILTNKPGQASVKISKAVSFESTVTSQPVEDALVQIHDDQGAIYELIHTVRGDYRNNILFAAPDRQYKLKIIDKDGAVYESEYQKLPSSFKQDSIYGSYMFKDNFVQSQSGRFYNFKKEGIETYVDLSSGSEEMPKCRYELLVTVLYTYYLPGLPPPTVFCWTTFNPNTDINLTNYNFESKSGILKKHIINFFSTNINDYDNRRPDYNRIGFMLTVNKYNLSTETYHYYQKIKDQLHGTGKIFDPLPAQIKGNIKCKSDPEKIVVGIFELSSFEKKYYRYNLYKDYTITEQDSFPGFTSSGESIAVPPPFWFYDT